MPRTAASKNNMSHPADHVSVLTGAFSSVDLLAVSRRPQHAAQKVVFTNTTATGVAVVFRGEDDIADTTMTVPPNGVPLVVPTPVKTLVSGGAAVEAHCYWWAGSGVSYNK